MSNVGEKAIARRGEKYRKEKRKEVGHVKSLKRPLSSSVKHNQQGSHPEVGSKAVEVKVKVVEEQADAVVVVYNRRIRVGPSYQADMSSIDAIPGTLDDALQAEDRDELMWCQSPSVVESGGFEPAELDQYLNYAASRRMAQDRALYILMNNDYSLAQAKRQVARRRRLCDVWNKNDTLLFNLALSVYGKNFEKIRKCIVHRGLRSLIAKYYTIKTERQTVARSSDGKRINKNVGDGLHNMQITEARLLEMVEVFEQGECGVCGFEGITTIPPPFYGQKHVCFSCAVYYDEHLYFPSFPADCSRPSIRKEPVGPPGMRSLFKGAIEDYVQLAANDSSTQVGGEGTRLTPEQTNIMKYTAINSEITALTVNCAKKDRGLEVASAAVERIDVDKYRSLVTPCPAFKQPHGRPNPIWSDEEEKSAAFALIVSELDYALVADVLQTKSVRMVQQFYKRRKTSIDKGLAERAARPAGLKTNVEKLSLGLRQKERVKEPEGREMQTK